MEGPPLGPGGEDITWPDQVAPRGRKASSTRKIKPQTSKPLFYKAKLQILQCNASLKHPNMRTHGTSMTESCESGFIRNNIIQEIRDRKIDKNMKISNILECVSTAADHRSRHNNSTDRRQSQISERRSKDSKRSEQKEYLQEQQQKASKREK